MQNVEYQIPSASCYIVIDVRTRSVASHFTLKIESVRFYETHMNRTTATCCCHSKTPVMKA